MIDERIKQKRLALGMSQDELAKRTGHDKRHSLFLWADKTKLFRSIEVCRKRYTSFL